MSSTQPVVHNLSSTQPNHLSSIQSFLYTTSPLHTLQNPSFTQPVLYNLSSTQTILYTTCLQNPSLNNLSSAQPNLYPTCSLHNLSSAQPVLHNLSSA